ncbi:MAG: alpha/beta hydrolase [Anaerolineaceae bacterium]|nr:alpha/beta hydrolase [Anaerolineaceae bacterium]
MHYDFKNIQAGDVSLAYVERGQGAPLVLLHGSGPTDLRTWGQQIEPFAEHYRVIAYSQRYHYPNAWLDDDSSVLSTYVHASDLAALIAALQLGRVHLNGFSYGADIALRFALEHPDLLHTLVVGEPGLNSWLVTLPGGAIQFAESARTLQAAKTEVQNGNLARGLQLFMDVVMGVSAFDQIPPALYERLLANVRLIGYEQTEISESVTDITRAEATAIRTPTLILTGDESPEAFLLVSQELARWIPHAEQAQITGASHLLHVMNPTDYNATVLRFLARHAPDG